MGRRVQRCYASEPPAAEPPTTPTAAKVKAGVAKRRATHEELVALMSTMLRPAEGVFTRWSTLRRMLALAGHRTVNTHVIAMALHEVAPDAIHRRQGTRQRGPRGVYGVELKTDLAALRRLLTPKWERRMGPELPPEVQLTSMEYKLSPANDNGRSYAGRLQELVTRVHLRKADASAYYGIACEYLHRAGMWAHYPGDKAIWALHCEGATRREIGQELQLNENRVQAAVDFHRARCGLVHR